MQNREGECWFEEMLTGILTCYTTATEYTQELSESPAKYTRLGVGIHVHKHY